MNDHLRPQNGHFDRPSVDVFAVAWSLKKQIAGAGNRTGAWTLHACLALSLPRNRDVRLSQWPGAA
jgi:hypothetical protein